jgi:hypothetical protein
MPDRHDLNPISVVEDLDPEPQGADRRRRLGELVLGLMLLIGVLSWGGWQWWHDTTLQEAYRTGSEAAERRDWDTARDAFRQASGYRDADSRAEDAARLVAGRDSRYAAATRALAEGRPLEAFQATTVLRTIQPDYRDTESLHERALKGALDNALVGAAMNGLAPVTGLRPGLYVGLASGSVRLEGSDLISLVRAGPVDGPAGCALYDAPSPGGRSLRLACVQGDAVRTEPLDPGFQPDDFDRYVAGTTGAWGLSVAATGTPVYQGTDTGEIERRNRLQGSLIGYDVTFLPAGGRAISYPLPEPNWIIMALGDHGRTLLAQSVEINPGVPGMALYLVRPGTAPGLLYRQESGFISAHMGPNERYVLLSSYVPLPASRGEEHRLVLIDTATGATNVLASGTSYSQREDPAPHVGGAFIRGGPLDGKVVVAHWAYEGSITLIDPERPDEPLAGLPVSGYPGSQVYAAGSPEGLVVVGWQAVNLKGRGPTSVEIAVLRPGRESNLLEGPLPDGETLWGVAMRGDNAVYIARRTGYPVTRHGPVTVRSLYAPQGSQAAQVRVLYTEPAYDWSQMSERTARPAFSWHLGKEGVTYSEEGLLQVAPFDGGSPVILSAAVSALPFTGGRGSEWVR